MMRGSFLNHATLLMKRHYNNHIFSLRSPHLWLDTWVMYHILFDIGTVFLLGVFF